MWPSLPSNKLLFLFSPVASIEATIAATNISWSFSNSSKVIPFVFATTFAGVVTVLAITFFSTDFSLNTILTKYLEVC